MFHASYAPLLLLAANPLRLIISNNALNKLVEYDNLSDLGEGDVLNKLWAHQEDRERFTEKLYAAGSCTNFETNILSASGRHIPTMVSGQILEINNELCALFHLQDLTSQKLAEAQLKASAKRLQDAQQIAKVGDFEIDVLAKSLSTSDELNNLLNLTQSKTENFDLSTAEDLIHPDDIIKFKGLKKSNYDVEFKLRHPIGDVEWLHLLANLHRDEDNRITRITGVIQDITSRIKIATAQEDLRKQMLQTQKLESLGVLAGGIAHDFNNLLTTILGNADLARVSFEDLSQLDEHLSDIVNASHRAADLTRQLLAYSGEGKFVIETMDIGELIRNMGKLLLVSIGKNVQLDYNLIEDLPSIEGDRVQIQQIIMNLIINASEALEGQYGQIKITTGIDPNTGYVQGDFIDLMPTEERQVFLEIEDTGIGMNDATRERIFDPFFTTKFTGRGLGMAAVLGIIRGHHGAVRVNSVENVGTRIRILFPHKKPSRPQTVEKTIIRVKPTNESVLIVDDEEDIRKVLQRMLVSEGYRVLLAADGTEALATLQQRPDIELVILDLTMPNMDGKETYRRIRAANYKAEVILMSGYTEQEADRQLGHNNAKFIKKPFDSIDILSLAAKILSA